MYKCTRTRRLNIDMVLAVNNAPLNFIALKYGIHDSRSIENIATHILVKERLGGRI
jgi:hypothetical protein